jgi:lauroyl/myristoyl acyltransferase
VSGHNGLWWGLPAVLAARGYRVTAVFTPIKFPRLERKLIALSARFGVKIAFVGRGAYAAAREAVERNEILYLTFDVVLHSKRKREFAFGGGMLEVDLGPAITAIRHGMPVLQAATWHASAGRSQVSFYPPAPDELNPTASTPEALCERWVRGRAQEARPRPEQWWRWGYVALGQPTPPAGPALSSPVPALAAAVPPPRGS